ncbi:MAG TPA: sigma-54 dependent transcriptional regulator [Terriglobia bacterium]|nr:sigma-54 dependent transcriptional regulator [Terriglobia bacterium]
MNQVLVVDDEAAIREALEANFRRGGWNVVTASGASEALFRFRQQPCPLVITDMRMPDGDGLQVMEGVRALAPQTAVIFLTAFGNVPEAVAAMKEGACDYLEKPVSFDRLQAAAQRVLASGLADEKKSRGLLVGRSPALRSAIQRAMQAAGTDVDVLIQAESGTGKELFAKLIHHSSARRHGPFVAVNCAAFPDTLLESELYGHQRGAFTGATAAKPGKFELASGGTLLLDEIGEMPLALQAKLLRVLQEREIDPLGATRPVRVDLRVVATTNRSLGQLVEEGKFRADLYYRLNVVPVAIPPLRERREDIAELVDHFLAKHGKARPPLRFSEALLERLRAYSWPGNVRQLENFVRRVLVLCPGPVAEAHLFQEEETADASPGEPELRPGMALHEMERKLIERTLAANGGNRTATAEMLGVSLRTIRNKIREYGLPPRSSR